MFFTELDFIVLFLYKMFTSVFQVNTVFGVSFFLSASLVNKPCCFHSPYIIVRSVPSFPIMLKCAYAYLD